MPDRTVKRRASGDRRARLGGAAERLAAAFLEQRGYAIIRRNVFLAGGEIDLVAIERGQTVLIEVRSRRDGDLDAALSSLTPAKQRRMIRAAETFLALNPDLPGEARIDFVAVALSPRGELRRIDLVVNALRD